MRQPVAPLNLERFLFWFGYFAFVTEAPLTHDGGKHQKGSAGIESKSLELETITAHICWSLSQKGQSKSCWLRWYYDIVYVCTSQCWRNWRWRFSTAWAALFLFLLLSNEYSRCVLVFLIFTALWFEQILTLSVKNVQTFPEDLISLSLNHCSFTHLPSISVSLEVNTVH